MTSTKSPLLNSISPSNSPSNSQNQSNQSNQTKNSINNNNNNSITSGFKLKIKLAGPINSSSSSSQQQQQQQQQQTKKQKTHQEEQTDQLASSDLDLNDDHNDIDNDSSLSSLPPLASHSSPPSSLPSQSNQINHSNHHHLNQNHPSNQNQNQNQNQIKSSNRIKPSSIQSNSNSNQNINLNILNKTKSKNNPSNSSNSNRSSKKRKPQPKLINQQQQLTQQNPPPPQQQQQQSQQQPFHSSHQNLSHTQNMPNEIESELSSCGSDQDHDQPQGQDHTIKPSKFKKIKLTNPTTLQSKPKSVRSSKLIPLSDAELLSAAGSNHPLDSINSLQNHSIPTSSSISNLNNLSNKNNLQSSSSSSQILPSIQSIPNRTLNKKKRSNNLNKLKSSSNLINSNHQNLIPSQIIPINQLPPLPKPPPTLSKSLISTKSRSKNRSKSIRSNQDLFQRNSSTSNQLLFQPPKPRKQHDPNLGPPPPPPVPAFKSLPVGPAPRAQGPFLPAQVLEKRTPKVRSWKKQRRLVVGISGIPFWVWTYVGDQNSDYANFKKNQFTQTVSTPISTPQPHYFTSNQPSRPASAASSSHQKQSPIRNSTQSRSKFQSNDIPQANLGGPVLPPSFRRPPLSTGSPLSLKALDSTQSASGSLDGLRNKLGSVSSRVKLRDSSSSTTSWNDSSKLERLPNKISNQPHPDLVASKKSLIDQVGTNSVSAKISSVIEPGTIKLPDLTISKK